MRMPHEDFPLLELVADLEECQAILHDMAEAMDELLRKTEGAYPPGGRLLVQRLAALLLQVQDLIPPPLAEAIAAERQASDAAEDRRGHFEL
jgi:hypothetical protein